MTETGDFVKLVTSLLQDDREGVKSDSTVPVFSNWAYDFFISYASEDRNSVASPLALELRERGWRVWFDQSALSVGDSLRESIDDGLSTSRFGVVILSGSFLKKAWTRRELGGLVAREVAGEIKILPIWHGTTSKDVLDFSPPLADRVTLDTTAQSIPEIVDEIERAIKASKTLT